MTHDQPSGPTDIVLAALLAARAMDDEIARRLTRDGYDMRSSDRAVFPLLMNGTVTASVLAKSLGITQQATSKALADLELRGYVERDRRPQDARTRPRRLSIEGRRLVHADRDHRALLHNELAIHLGADGVEMARAILTGIAGVSSDQDPGRGRRFGAST
jgi:DNA-binding MarR family transcriptional regulator